MKPAPFDLVTPTTVEEAVDALAEENAVVLAGGQSLVPLLALRRRRPRLLVDVNRLPLSFCDRDVVLEHHIPVTEPEGVVRVGALVRHSRLERDPVVVEHAPLLAATARWIGSPAIRHRGTLGGSLAHAEPAAELPAAVVALGGEVVAQGPDGIRTLAATDLFAGPYATTLAPDELIVEVRVPAAGRRHGAAFCEWAARHNDLPDAGVAVAVERDDDGCCVEVRAAACGVSTTPVPLAEAFAPVLGETTPDDELLREVAARVHACVGEARPLRGDRHRDRAEMTGLLGARALWRAFARTEGDG
jgi:aerobic carbon-monoxide dehydrogenase medium subunit